MCTHAKMERVGQFGSLDRGFYRWYTNGLVVFFPIRPCCGCIQYSGTPSLDYDRQEVLECIRLYYHKEGLWVAQIRWGISPEEDDHLGEWVIPYLKRRRDIIIHTLPPLRACGARGGEKMTR